MRDFRVILISNARPPERSAAAITLARHLVGQPHISLETRPSDAREIFPTNWIVRLMNRIANRGMRRLANDFWFLIHAYVPMDRWLRPPGRSTNATVVLTLAYGNGWLVAARYASRHRLPLLVRFDDWWPDIAQVHSFLKPLLERKYRELSRTANVNICISDGMTRELGENERSRVILPIPESGRLPPPPRAIQDPFRVCYMGNMVDYGPMLEELLVEAEGAQNVRFEFCGSEPSWPDDLKQRLRTSGQLHGFLEGTAFKTWYESFDAHLVVMFFDPKHARRVRTCFATKLIDYSSLGRPIVIWAPEESSVVEWARRTDGAVCVTDPDPRAVLVALHDLAMNHDRRRALGLRARQSYETEFSPDSLQEKFLECLACSQESR